MEITVNDVENYLLNQPSKTECSLRIPPDDHNLWELLIWCGDLNVYVNAKLLKFKQRRELPEGPSLVWQLKVIVAEVEDLPEPYDLISTMVVAEYLRAQFPFSMKDLQY